MSNNKYYKHNKALRIRGSRNYDGNLIDFMSQDEKMFTCGDNASFNGFSGTTEFEAFPLRQLFLNRHKRFPCEWDTGYISLENVNKYVEKHKSKVIVTHYGLNGKDIERCVLYLKGVENIYVYLYNRRYYSTKNELGVCLLFSKKTERVEKIMNEFIKMIIPVKKEESGCLNLLCQTESGFELNECSIKKPDIDFGINYNEEFRQIHDLIVDKLSVNKSKGLVLLHGIAGSGKTTYIRYLINCLKKRVIYIPPNMTNAISDPGVIKFFVKHPDSVLVIEDAENVLTKRTASSSQAVSNVLNLTDGLLSDCANIQIVATFNTDILNIDPALLRKGRLIAKYEFKPLDEDRAKRLSEKLGVKIEGNNTLADIYNAEDKSFVEKKQIGFAS
jgi:hypothetical protein